MINLISFYTKINKTVSMFEMSSIKYSSTFSKLEKECVTEKLCPPHFHLNVDDRLDGSRLSASHHLTVVQKNQESRLQYWVTRSSVRSFACTAHSLACLGLLASLAPSAVLTRPLACSLLSLPCSWESEFFMS